MRVALERLLHQQCKALIALPHVRVAGRQPNARAARERNHDRSSTARTRASAAASTPLSTITRRPRVSTISIRPGAATGHGEDDEFSTASSRFREWRRTARRRLVADDRRCKRCGLIGLDKAPLSGQAAPREKLARRQTIPPRRRRHKPRRTVARRHDPLLLFQCPTAPGTRRDYVEPRDLRNRRMVRHTPMSSPTCCIRQGGTQRRDTL